MTQRTSVPSRPPSTRVSSQVASSSVVVSPLAPPSVAPSTLVSFPPDIVRLLEVFARIELRRQLRLRELQEREAS
jgi:hypothetical protein